MSGAIAKLFQTLTHGVYVVGVAHDNRFNAFTASSVMHVSYNPLQLALSINAHHSSYSLLKGSGMFSVNVLKRGQIDFAANYAKPASSSKMTFAAWSPGRTGAPLLQEALAWFECKVTGDFPAGDHRLVLGKVISGKIVDQQGEPMTYRETESLDDVAELFPDVLG
jgi:flavin reductase (DIM6/NTAB) family NADH-FMN oxidoreductase RutF